MTDIIDLGYMAPQDWQPEYPKRPGHIPVRCTGGCMNGQIIDIGVSGMFFRALDVRGIDGHARGYLPDCPVDCYRIKKWAGGIITFELEH